MSLRAGRMGADDRAVPVPPLVVHVLHRFDTGGLENGVVNLINHMPADRFRHRIVALTEVTDFRLRLRRSDVECVALHKPPGHGARLYPRLWQLLREWRPAVVHTRNLAALEMQAAAWAAGVPVRIHGEHGRDIDDLDGSSRKHQVLRRVYAPFVHRWVALSRDLAGYLQAQVGIRAERIEQVYNGVDDIRFRPAGAGEPLPTGFPFAGDDLFVVGTVGRLQPVKNQVLLARAFVRALQVDPALRARLRLIVVGDGPLRPVVQSVLDESGVSCLAWMAGERTDVADVMRALDCFVLPSLAEGISNTILEAMASGLPVVATAVGGNPELVADGQAGRLVASEDVEAMAVALVELARQPQVARRMGRSARDEVERRFSLQAMVAAYQGLYERQLARRGQRVRGH